MVHLEKCLKCLWFDWKKYKVFNPQKCKKYNGFLDIVKKANSKEKKN